MADKYSAKKEEVDKWISEIAVQALYSGGLLTEQDLINKNTFLDKMLKINQSAEYNIIIDHRNQILEYALSYYNNKEYNFSIMFYSLFFEHSINSIILNELRRRQFSRKKMLEIIRSVNINNKLTWLIQILYLPKFNENHKEFILKGINERNTFVHYKFPVIPDDKREEERENVKKRKLAENLRKTATYMKRYESRVLFSGRKEKLRKLLK